jgi:hypothetical protein
MADENAPTGDPVIELLEQILARLSSLEATVEDRLRDTRPLWKGFGERFDKLEEFMKDVRTDVRLLREDIRNERKERIELAERVEDIELNRRQA